MARQKANGVFVVTPVQFEEDEAVQGISFQTASQASAFASKLQKFARNTAAKIKGVDAKTMTGGIAVDILMQPTDSDGEPTGNPALFDTVGLES